MRRKCMYYTPCEINNKTVFYAHIRIEIRTPHSLVTWISLGVSHKYATTMLRSTKICQFKEFENIIPYQIYYEFQWKKEYHAPSGQKDYKKIWRKD